MMMKVRYSDRR